MTAAYVTLASGQVVTRDAEEWRHECLARHVLALPSKPARQAWLADFAKANGEPTTQALKDTMAALWKKDKA